VILLIEKYEDPFVKIANMIGGDEYLKVARSLLKAQDATDEEIASSTGLRINMVRKILYDLFGKALITGIRVKDERKGWFVYRWRSRKDEVENFMFLIVPPSSDSEISLLFVLIELLRLVSGSGLISTAFNTRLVCDLFGTDGLQTNVVLLMYPFLKNLISSNWDLIFLPLE